MIEAKETSTAIKKYMEYLRSLVLFAIIIINNNDIDIIAQHDPISTIWIMTKYDFEPMQHSRAVSMANHMAERLLLARAALVPAEP
jgi:hypothetical protein